MFSKILEEYETRKRRKFLNFVSNPEIIKNILVLRNGMMGDITFITSGLYRLNNTFRKASIDIIVGPKATEILKEFPGIRNIIPFTFNFSFLSIIKQIIFFWKMRVYKYDLVIVQELNTHFTFMCKLINARYLIGFKNTLSYLYDYTTERPKMKAVLAEMQIVKDWTKSNGQDKSHLFISENELKTARLLLSNHGINNGEKICVIHIGSNSPDSDRQWVNNRYSELADCIIEKHKCTIIFTGVKHDIAVIESIQKAMRNSSISLAGKTGIRTLMGILKLSNLIIGVDTGTLHIASALDTPVIMLMGLADENDTGVYNPTINTRIVKVDLPCRPCINKNPKPLQWKECCNIRPVKCMSLIQTKDVLKAVDYILSN